jgi:hypothetical protein
MDFSKDDRLPATETDDDLWRWRRLLRSSLSPGAGRRDESRPNATLVLILGVLACAALPGALWIALG